MAEKFNTRIIHKHDIEANWAKATGFIPKEAELIVYDPDENFSYARTKMGDGITKVNDLPFINVQADWNQNDENAADYIKNRPFYEGEGLESIFPKTGESQTITLVDMRADGLNDITVGDWGYEFQIDSELKGIDGIVSNKQFKVILNGISYTCTSILSENYLPEPILYIGNASLIDKLFADTKEPFCIVGLLDWNTEKKIKKIYITVDYTIIPQNKNIDLFWGDLKGKKVYQISETYIPDSIARSSNVLTSVNPQGTGSFSMNRAKSSIGKYSHAVGSETVASGNSSHAEGFHSKATGDFSHAEGYYTYACGSGAHAEGGSTNAIKEVPKNLTLSQIEDIWTQTAFSLAFGARSHIEGQNTLAFGDQAHAEGYKTRATGKNSHAENHATQASGDHSHAEGNGTHADSNSSHAEGSGTIASGDSSHAEGRDTYAIGKQSHAEGLKTCADGEGAHAEGYNAYATGNYSHAEGYGTNAYGINSHVQGKFNIVDEENKYAHIVGNGENYSDKASNAHTLDWEGNAWYSGDVYVGSTSGINRDEGSKKLATEEYIINKLNEFNLISIDYANLLSFDVSEVIIERNTSSVLGQAMLGQLILA